MVRLLNPKAECPGHRQIKSRMEDMRLKLQEELGLMMKDEWVTISSDGWTSRSGDTYLGVTYHYIDSNWDLRSLTVDVEKLEGSTTGEELTLKVPTAWCKRTVAGIVGNVTDCKTFMCLVFMSSLVCGGNFKS
jgi:hypothetical protein